MLCSWIFLFLTSGTIAQFRNEEDYRCIIPASDVVKNGKFSVYRWSGSTWEGKEQPPAGTKLLSYELEFQCDPGFFLRGNPDVRCVPAEMEEFPVCSETCESSDPDCPIQNDGIISSNLDGLTANDDCGIVSNAPTALAGGRAAVPGDVPWQAAIYDKSTSPFMQVCGGSIVSKDVIISAAHCFKLPDEFYAVAVGKIYRPYDNPMDSTAQKSEVLEIRTPPRYRGSVTSFQDDIAAVILATPIKFTSMIKPVCLHFGADFDEVQLTPGMKGRVAGWGIDSQNGRPSQVLNLAEMPMVDIGTCFMLQDISFIQYITSDKICAGYTNGTSLCKGDSGGGLAVPHKSGYISRYYLRGVVSTGPPPATINECNVNAVTTFTRVAKHEFFVKSAIAKKPLQEGELRIPSIIPANFIIPNQNILSNGVTEGIPLRADPVQQIGIFTNQRPVFGNNRDPQAAGPGTVGFITDTLTIDRNQNIEAPLKDDSVQTINFISERPIGNFGYGRYPLADAPGTVVDIPNPLTTNTNLEAPAPLREDAFNNERPILGSFGNSRDPQADAPGTVVVIPDPVTTNIVQNTQVPLREDAFNNERLIVGSFGNSRDPQADAPGTVVVIPDPVTTNIVQNTQVPLREDAFNNERLIVGSFGNSRDPQADAPGTVVVIPDPVTTNIVQNTQVPLREDAFNTERPTVDSFGNSRDPQADAPGTVEVIPDPFTTNTDPKVNVPLREDAFNNEWPTVNSFGNSRDPQADAPGTVVVIPDTLVTDRDQNRQVPLSEDAFNNERPIVNSFDNNRDPQANASGTVVVIPNTLTIDANKNTEDPLREDSVQPVSIFNNQQPDFDSSRDPNVPVTETLINTGIKNDERPLKDNFIPKPVAGLVDDKVFTGLNKDYKGSSNNTNISTVTSTDKNKVISVIVTTPSPQLHGAPDFNYQYLPYQPHIPYQHIPNQNWHYPSQSVHYLTQNVLHPSQNAINPAHNVLHPSQNVLHPSQNAINPAHNVLHPSQNVIYPSQNIQQPSHNEHQNAQNFDNNGYFGHGWQYRNPVWNSHNQNGHWWRK